MQTWLPSLSLSLSLLLLLLLLLPLPLLWEMSNIEKEGWGRKQGGRFTAYKKRYFQLKDGALYYFKSNKKLEKPQGVLNLAGCKVYVEENQKKHKNGLSISGPFPRVYHISCETPESMDEWLQAIQQTIDRLDGRVGGSGASGSSVGSAAAGDSEETIMVAGSKRVGMEDFLLDKVIGRGSFGKVYMVTHKETGKRYAMKALRKDVVRQENMVAHTKSEKEILQKMEHPFIVGLHFAFQTADKLYLVLDFLSGGELFHHLKSEGRFSESRAKLYTAEIGLALNHLHKNGVVYRDLKPENCVLDAEGHVCLTDFGLAKVAVEGQQTYTFCGTPEYLAPEILTGQGHDKAVDWWSLGILLYEMMTGLPPFYSENVNEMYNLILRGELRFPDYVSANARSLLTHLLDRDAKRRYGAGPNDFEELIRPHPFFADLDWAAVESRRVKAPFVPSSEDIASAKHFDEEFTGESARESIISSRETEVSSTFKDFTFAAASELDK